VPQTTTGEQHHRSSAAGTAPIQAEVAEVRPDAARLPRLDILLDTSREHDAELARDLARFGRGRLAPVHSYRDVAPALAALFAP